MHFQEDSLPLLVLTSNLGPCQNDERADERVKLQALSLSAQVNQTRNQIIADAYRVSQAVQSVERTVLKSQIDSQLEKKDKQE